MPPNEKAGTQPPGLALTGHLVKDEVSLLVHRCVRQTHKLLRSLLSAFPHLSIDEVVLDAHTLCPASTWRLGFAHRSSPLHSQYLYLLSHLSDLVVQF